MALDAATRSAFLRALDEDPEFYQAVRQRLLSEELLSLPHRLAVFIEATNRRIEALDTTLNDFIVEQREVNERSADFIDEQREVNRQTADFITEQREINQQTADFIVEQREVNRQTADFITEQREINQQTADFIVEQRQVNEQTAEFIVEQRDINRQTLEHQRRTDSRIDRIVDDLGFIKGNIVGRAAQDHFEQISEQLGFNFVRMLSRNDLINMVRNGDAADIAFGDRRSFYNADVVMEVADDTDGTHYVAVEASYTADLRDTARAVRNAEFLTRFMGRPAHAVIASVGNDRQIKPLLDDGTLHWFQIFDRDIQPR